MLATCNENDPDPTVQIFKVSPFGLLDFATVAADSSLRTDGTHHLTEYTGAALNMEWVCHETLMTMAEISRVPSAPVSHAFLYRMQLARTEREQERPLSCDMVVHPEGRKIFEWVKALERMLMIFVERNVFGRAASASELRHLRRTILARMQASSFGKRLATRSECRARARAIQAIQREWADEARKGPGWMTRALISGGLLRDTANVEDVAGSFRSGLYRSSDVREHEAPELVPLARDLIDDALGRAKVAKLRVR
jgi:hypothetical protein